MRTTIYSFIVCCVVGVKSTLVIYTPFGKKRTPELHSNMI